MMRTKRKKNIDQNDSKKQKYGIEQAPLPSHITIKNNKLLYHFDEFSSATKFRDVIQGNLSVAHTRCEHGQNHRSCHTVSIRPDQFDYLVGTQHGYLQLLKIHKSLTSFNMKSTRWEIVGMNPRLANQAVLLMDENDGCLFLEWLFGENKEKEICYDLVSFFIPLLNSEIINRLALIHDIHIPLNSATTNHSAINQFIFDNLTPETCNQIALDANRVLEIIKNVKDKTLLNFFKKLNTTTINNLALAPTKTNECLLDVISNHCRNSIIYYFVSQLTPETCEQLNQKELRIFTALVDAKTYKSFMEKLRPTSQIDRAFNKDLVQERISTDTLLKSLSIVENHPLEVKIISKEDPHLDNLFIWDGGRSQDSWSKITRQFVTRAPAPSEKKKEHDLSFKLDNTEQFTNFKSLRMEDIQQKEWSYLRIQGRTVLFTNPLGEILAVKIQKKSEPVTDLVKEFQTTSYLKANAKKLNLKSKFPTPVDLISLKEIYPWLSSVLKTMIGDDDKRIAYIYKVDPKQCDYFTYLHDPMLSDEIFNKANRDAVHDLFVLLQHGVVFSQLADIFHNSEKIEKRKDRGRYIVLVNLLNNWDHGSGRVTSWREAVDYPNLRPSGIADLGDRISVNDFIKDSELVRQFYSEPRRHYGDKTGNFLLANVMAEYQYVLFLIAGRRGYELTKNANKYGLSLEYIANLWQNIAKQIVDNCAQAVSIMTKLPENQVNITLSSIVDINRLATQMQYWMTEDYIQDILNNKIREGVYGSFTDVEIDINEFRENTFNLTHGCSIDGTHSDLGPVNGQEPIKEANKLFYWMVTEIFAEYEKLRTTLNNLHEITSTKNLKKSEALRKQSFFHLPEKAYRAMQYTLCNERLKQPLSDKHREALLAEAKEHKEHHAAAVIQNHWRYRRK